MRVLLAFLFLALAATFAAAATASADISITLYKTKDCSGDATYNKPYYYPELPKGVNAAANITFSAGCFKTDMNNYQLFSVASDNYQVAYYKDDQCTEPAYEYSTSYFPANTCVRVIDLSFKIMINNPSAGPVAAAFPAAGFVKIVKCYTVADWKGATSCAASDSVYCKLSATKSAFCKNSNLASFDYSTSNALIAENGLYGGSITYAGKDCKGSVISASLSKLGCYDGETYIGNGASTLPTTLPAVGYGDFGAGSNNCAEQTSFRPSYSLYVDGACGVYEDSKNPKFEKYSCSTVNGTSAVVRTQYAAATTQCGATAEATTSNAVGCDVATGRSYSCTAAPSVMSGAASVSVSMVALVAAAFVALVAGRQL